MASKKQADQCSDDEFDAMILLLEAVKNDSDGREYISRNEVGLPFFKGRAPAGHSQPWVFEKFDLPPTAMKASEIKKLKDKIQQMEEAIKVEEVEIQQKEAEIQRKVAAAAALGAELRQQKVEFERLKVEKEQRLASMKQAGGEMSAAEKGFYKFYRRMPDLGELEESSAGVVGWAGFWDNSKKKKGTGALRRSKRLAQQHKESV
tara:strand:- start:214 stop:828 length:615 start_codon:yes stop_codon:yes gene_type:complete